MRRPAHGLPLYGRDFADDPAGAYARLRAHGPVAPVELAPGVPATLVTSYNAALDVLRDPTTFPKDARRWERGVPPGSPVLSIMGYEPNCRHADGAAHERLRLAVTDSLGRVDLSALRGHVERSADTLIGRFAPRGIGDLIADYARVLPVLVFNELFGCPVNLGGRLVQAMSGVVDVEAVRNVVVELVALKRREPADDVTSWLAEHSARLSDEELMHQLIALLRAGTEPLQNLIANALRLLLSDGRFAGSLSGGSLPVEDALDEVLWTDPPLANFAITFPTQDLDFAGVRLPRDHPVVISLAAANTDPALIAANREGNRAHLAWSAGPHTCPAQGQARLIASTAIEKLLDALPGMELAIPTSLLEWRPGPFHRALIALPVNFPRAPVPVGADETTGEIPFPLPATRRDAPEPIFSSAPPPRSPTDWSFRAPDGLAAILSAGRDQGDEEAGPFRRRWNAVARRLRSL